MERQPIPFEIGLDRYVERLSEREKADIVKLARLDMLLRQQSERGFAYDTGKTWEEGENVTYFKDPNSFYTGFRGFWQPISYPEVRELLGRWNDSVDNMLDYQVRWQGSTNPLVPQIKELTEQPIAQEDYQAVPELLRQNFRAVSQSWLEHARHQAAVALDTYEKSLRYAQQFATMSGDTIPDEELARLQTTYHKQTVEVSLEEIEQLSRLDPKLAHLHKNDRKYASLEMQANLNKAIEAQVALGKKPEEDTRIKGYAQQLLPDVLVWLQSTLSEWQEEAKLFEKSSMKKYEEIRERAAAYATVAGVDLTEQLQQLDIQAQEQDTRALEQIAKIQKKRNTPIWKRPFIK